MRAVKIVFWSYMIIYFGFIAVMLIGDLPMFKNFKHQQPPFVRGCILGVLGTWEGMNKSLGHKNVKITKTEVDTANDVCKRIYEQDQK